MSLDKPALEITPGPVRIIILYPEIEGTDLEDSPIEEVKASLHRALQQAATGQRLPLSQLWAEAESQN